MVSRLSFCVAARSLINAVDVVVYELFVSTVSVVVLWRERNRTMDKEKRKHNGFGLVWRLVWRDVIGNTQPTPLSPM